MADNNEFVTAIDNALVPWQELVAQCLCANNMDKKAIIKLPCKLTIKDHMDVNAICFVKCGKTIHTIFANYEDGKCPDFCVTDAVKEEINKYL